MKNTIVLLSTILFINNHGETKKINCEEFYNRSSLLGDLFFGEIMTKMETELTYIFVRSNKTDR
ncbi:hypothetical protein KO493_09365 [Tamlana agarivorans]|uniref:Uncharacterized protein n=1 Tax=Pseudotamlana agarivorans TaxID=481183 RepID=A0ACC5U9C5_9FLAO|nr:hypothetical protein [Tamlana agarivorans]MBU2950906.1 hypothetical protein [Tamlana agarivorans]